MNNDCTLLISSCDAYADIWPAFFTLLTKHWQIPYPIVLNTETKAFSYPGLDIRTYGLHGGAGPYPWADRLLDTLAKIDTEYVFLVLEDFFVTAPVNQPALDACLQALRENPDIAVFSFYPAPGPNTPSEEYPGYELRGQTAPYRFNCQAAIWRKHRLESFLQRGESAWGWEVEGNLRSYTLADRFYSVIRKEDSPFPYDPFEHGVYNGKWLEAVPPLFAKHGIAIDFSLRGFFDEKQKALHPQVGINFKTDAILYINRGHGFNEADALFLPSQQPGTTLNHTFSLPADGPLDRFLRLDPTSSGYCMFRSLSVTLCYTDGKTERYSIGQYGTNGIVDTDGTLVFFCEDPMISLYTRRGHRLASLQVTGEAVPRIPEAVIDRVRPLQPDRRPAKRQKLRSYFPF